MPSGSSMVYHSDITLKLYHHLAELEEKLLKSESERKSLETKFEYLSQAYKDEEKLRINILNEKYNEFLKYCRGRNERNEKILRSLEKVESGANAVFAKTERLKQLRTHYDAYVSRMIPLWKQMPALQFRNTSARPLGRTISDVSTNTILEEPLLLPLAGTTSDFPHISGGGVGVGLMPNSRLVNSSGLKKIGYGPIYVIPEKDLSCLQELTNRMNLLMGTLPTGVGDAAKRMLKELNRQTESDQRGNMISPEIKKINLGNSTYSNEANKLNSPVKQEPQQYRYGMWPHIRSPPSGFDFSSVKLSQSPNQGIVSSYSKKPASPKSSNESYLEENQLLSQETPTKLIESVLPASPKNDFKREKSREHFEIECLAADGNFGEEDENLSDDEVLGGAMLGTSGMRRDQEMANVPPVKLHRQVVDPERNYKTSGSYAHATNPQLGQERIQESSIVKANFVPRKGGDMLENVAQRSAVAHQKSVEELKAMLSFEEDEANELPLADSLQNQEDEDVPEEFTEPTWPDGHYDPRYERDVSRNVILEEDEPEEPELERPGEGRHERRDWRKLQYYKDQGKLVPQNFNEGPQEPREGGYSSFPGQDLKEGASVRVAASDSKPFVNPQPRMLSSAVTMFKNRRKSVRPMPDPNESFIQDVRGYEERSRGENVRDYHEVEQRPIPPENFHEQYAPQERSIEYQQTIPVVPGEVYSDFQGKPIQYDYEARPDSDNFQMHSAKAASRSGERNKRETPDFQVPPNHLREQDPYPYDTNEHEPPQFENEHLDVLLDEAIYEGNLEKSFDENQQRYPDWNPSANEQQYQESPQHHDIVFNTMQSEYNPLHQNMGFTDPAIYVEQNVNGDSHVDESDYRRQEGDHPPRFEEQNTFYEGYSETPGMGELYDDTTHHSEMNVPPMHSGVEYEQRPVYREENRIDSRQEERFDGSSEIYGDNRGAYFDQPYQGPQGDYQDMGQYSQEAYNNEPQQQYPYEEQYQEYDPANDVRHGEQHDGPVERSDIAEYVGNYDEKGQAEQYEHGCKENTPIERPVASEFDRGRENTVPSPGADVVNKEKLSVMAQLIDSDSESYQVSAEVAPDDSDFDFSAGKQ